MSASRRIKLVSSLTMLAYSIHFSLSIWRVARPQNKNQSIALTQIYDIYLILTSCLDELQYLIISCVFTASTCCKLHSLATFHCCFIQVSHRMLSSDWPKSLDDSDSSFDSSLFPVEAPMKSCALVTRAG